MKTIHNIIHRDRTPTSPTHLTATPITTPAQPKLSRSSDSYRSSDSGHSDDDSAISKELTRNNVRVICRLRPTLSSESPGDRSVVQVLNSTQIRITDPVKHLVNRFDFCACYDHQTSQQDIYNGQVHQLITRIFDGITVTIFAFGCTGSGKTHTLQGSPGDPGITPRAVRGIFNHVEMLKSTDPENSGSFPISISCFEIWKDKVWDLLAEGGTATTRDVGRGDLPIREAANGQIFIPKLRHVPITTIPQFDKIYAQLMRSRSVSSTKLNHASSRSHALLTIYVNHETPQGDVRQGKCVLVDLAGSENNKKTGNEANKERMKESVEINQSLLALRKVVRSLNEGDLRIPYRDSKLTRILSDSLGGTSAGLVICNIAPCASQYRDTINTLTFGSHTRNVENKITPKEPQSVDRNFRPTLGFYQHNHSKSTPNLHSQLTTNMVLASPATSRTPLEKTLSFRPTFNRLLRSKPSLLPVSPKGPLPVSPRVMISQPKFLERQITYTPAQASLPLSPGLCEDDKKVRFHGSCSNLFDASANQQHIIFERSEIASLDQRVEAVMRKTLDQLVEDRVDALMNARLHEASARPSATRTSTAGPAITTNKDEEDEKLVKRIVTLEQQFQREYPQSTRISHQFLPAKIDYQQDPRPATDVAPVHKSSPLCLSLARPLVPKQSALGARPPSTLPSPLLGFLCIFLRSSCFLLPRTFLPLLIDLSLAFITSCSIVSHIENLSQIFLSFGFFVCLYSHGVFFGCILQFYAFVACPSSPHPYPHISTSASLLSYIS